MTLPKDISMPLMQAAALLLTAVRKGQIDVPFPSERAASQYRLNFYRMMKVVRERQSPLPADVQEQVIEALSSVEIRLRGAKLHFTKRGVDLFSLSDEAAEEFQRILTASEKEKREFVELGNSLLSGLEGGGEVVPLKQRQPDFKYPLRGDD